MSLITFKKVRFKNFLSYSNKWSEIDLVKHPDSLLTGANGNGKSVLLDLMIYSLYGKPYRKIKKDELINNVNNKELNVELDFHVDEIPYKIVRGIKPNKFEVYRNNTLINQDSNSRDYQNMLEQSIIGMSEMTFRQTVILGSADYVPFMRMSSVNKRVIIEELLDIQLFSVMNKLSKGRIVEGKQIINDINNQLRVIETSIEYLNKSIQSESDNTEELINNNITKINESNVIINNIISLIPDEVDCSSLTVSKTKLMKKILKLNSFVDTFELNIKKSNKTVSFYEDNDHCPTCKQDLHDEVKCIHIENEKVEIDKFVDGTTKAKDTVTEVKKELTTVIDQLIIIEKDRDKSNELNQVIKTESDKKKVLQQQNRDIKNAKNTANQELERDGLLTNKVSKSEELIRSNTDNDVLYEIVELLKDDGVKSRIIRNYLPIFNKLISKYMNLLEFQETFTVDEQFNDVIKNGKNLRSYMSHSEGEKRRLDLAMLFAMCDLAIVKNSNRTNLLIMDEILDGSLDQDGLDAFLKIKHSLIDEGKNLIVISHRVELADKFSGHIQIDKLGRFSSITQL
jgi:DNA repair exonuclease SbcCD ATPase subunit